MKTDAPNVLKIKTNKKRKKGAVTLPLVLEFICYLHYSIGYIKSC
jgi:hypothetical protein